MVKTILPSHKTAVQKALDVLAGERFEALDLSVISILPMSCPAAILPHLAQSFDVDISGLDEAQTRELLQDAFQIHYFAGTPYSINRALQIVFADAGVEEWFSYGGAPYFFRINVEVYGAVVALYEKLIKTANRYKNARSLIDYLHLMLETHGKIYVGALSDSSGEVTIYPSNDADIAAEGKVYIACAVQAVYEVTIGVENE
jgi:phage tail P2-like protein